VRGHPPVRDGHQDQAHGDQDERHRVRHTPNNLAPPAPLQGGPESRRSGDMSRVSRPLCDMLRRR
jgi:hypothetical protein